MVIRKDQKLVNHYKDIKSKYTDIKGKLKAVMEFEITPTPAFQGKIDRVNLNHIGVLNRFIYK